MSKTISILAANPAHTDRLRLDEEARSIEEGLRRANYRDAFELRIEWAARADDMRRALADYRPALVQFSGHGEGEAGLVFESGSVDADTLAEFFKLHQDYVQCVMLNACYSAVQAQAIAKHIPYVIGMDRPISDQAAVTFATAFYDAISAQAEADIEHAYASACVALDMNGLKDAMTPVLHKAGGVNVRVQTARRMERSRAFIDALKVWREIQQIDSNDPAPAREIERLQVKIEATGRAARLKKKLSKQRKDIKAVFVQVFSLLKRIEKGELEDEAEVILDMVQEYLDGETDAEEFMEYGWDDWEAGSNANKTETDGIDYPDLAGRLHRGQVAVMLGPDLAAHFIDGALRPENLAPELAAFAEYPEFSGSLPEICEYLQLERGRTTLRDELQKLVEPSTPAPIALYDVLARLDTPLLVISSLYDGLLEHSLRQRGKKFVVLCHTPEQMGRLDLFYADSGDSETIEAEQLSGKTLMENGYSVIYRILGCFSGLAPGQGDALLLSEHDYFHFNRHVDKLLPHYIVRQLAGRGFWLLGYYPQSWEQRLLAETLFNARQHEERPLTVHADPDRFAKAYWTEHKVKNYPVALQEFVAGLQEALISI